MKSSSSLMLGAALVAGGWASMPGVAFADAARSGAELPRLQLIKGSAAVQDVGACHAGTHAHASGCTCARCTSGG